MTAATEATEVTEVTEPGSPTRERERHPARWAAVVIGLWASLLGRFEWAMLAIPLHLAGDRGIFGNRRKPVDRPFEHERRANEAA